MCKHEWLAEYIDNKEYARCSKCGLTRETCDYCEKEWRFSSQYGVFDFQMDMKGNVDIDSEHNDYDSMKFLYCPMCGRKLGE